MCKVGEDCYGIGGQATRGPGYGVLRTGGEFCRQGAREGGTSDYGMSSQSISHLPLRSVCSPSKLRNGYVLQLLRSSIL